jgi:hypothetical protein
MHDVAKLKRELDKLEKNISRLRCLKTDSQGVPPNGMPLSEEAERSECPHCRALRMIARIRAEMK